MWAVLKTLAVAILAVLAPVKIIMIAAGFMILADLVTGLWRAVKAKEEITSRGLRRTVTKVVAYELAVIVAMVMENYLLGGDVPVIKIVASLIAMTEGKSILENLSEVTGVNFMQLLMEKLQGTPESSIPANQSVPDDEPKGEA